MRSTQANNITEANTTDVNTTSAERIHETAAVPTHILSDPPLRTDIPLRRLGICESAVGARVLHGDIPWRPEVLYEARIYMPSLQAFVETLRPQVLTPTHLCVLPERWFPLSGGHQPFVRLTSVQSTGFLSPGALTERRNLPRRRGGERRWARV